MIEIPRQRPPFFDSHVSVHERVDLADRSFGDGADIISRSDADQIHRPEQAIGHAAPKISRTLTHQRVRLIEVVVIDDRLEIFFAFRRRGTLERFFLCRHIFLAVSDRVVDEILRLRRQAGRGAALFL